MTKCFFFGLKINKICSFWRFYHMDSPSFLCPPKILPLFLSFLFFSFHIFLSSSLSFIFFHFVCKVVYAFSVFFSCSSRFNSFLFFLVNHSFFNLVLIFYIFTVFLYFLFVFQVKLLSPEYSSLFLLSFIFPIL